MKNPSPEHADRVGPNSIIRIAEVVQESPEASRLAEILTHAGLNKYLEKMPEAMVDEQEVMRLHQSLRDLLGVARAREIARQAGYKTAGYLLAVRIPKPIQSILKILPARLAAPILVKAIAANAWTFVGSGQFKVESRYPVRFQIVDSILCRGEQSDQTLCDFYSGTYQRLFATLVHPAATVTETACRATNKPYCRFEINW